MAAIGLQEFETLFKVHHSMLCQIAFKIVDDKDAAQDIVQDVFYKLWNKKDSLQIKTSSKGYLLKATTNASLNFLEREKKTISLEAVKERPIEGSDAASKMDQAELEEKIKKAIAKLPAKCKTIFVLSRFEEMKYQEIADHLNISIKTVENQMGKALKRLREDLKPFLTSEFIGLVVTVGLSALLYYLSLFLLLFLP